MNEKTAMVLADVLEKRIKDLNDCKFLIINVSDFNSIDSKIVIAAFKILQEKEIGKFIIGRRGKKTRLEVGTNPSVVKKIKNKDDYKLIEPEDGPFSKIINDKTVDKIVDKITDKTVINKGGFKINVLNNYICLYIDKLDGFNTVDEAVENYNFDETFQNKLGFIKDQLLRFGFVMIDKIGREK